MTPIISERASADSPGAIPVTIIGGGAAGLATAIFLARFLAERGSAPGASHRIVLLDCARTLGAKILVAGGSRCNVTNANVDAADFWRGGSSFVKQVLRAFPVADTIAFFEGIGVELKQEPLGKMFPKTNKSRTVLEALLRETHRLGIEIQTSVRVTGLRRDPNAWVVETSAGDFVTKQVVLATGGLSLPKTGSDGLGYVFAQAAGHSLVPTVPALEPLILSGDFHAALSGIAHDASIRISRHGEKTVDIRGSLLWTHFGISGPLPLNASRFFRRAKSENASLSMTLSFVPDHDANAVDSHFIAASQDRPHHNVATEVVRAFGLIQSVALRLVTAAIGQDEPLSRLSKEKRRSLVTALTAFPLNVIDGRGYNFAEGGRPGVVHRL